MTDLERLAVEALTAISVFLPLVERETQALKSMKAKEVQALQADKQAAASRYQAAMAALAARRHDWARLAERTRAALKTAAARLDRILADNLSAAQAAQRGAKRLVEVMVAALRDAAQPTRSYAPNPYGVAAYAQSRAPVSVAVNRTL